MKKSISILVFPSNKFKIIFEHPISGFKQVDIEHSLTHLYYFVSICAKYKKTKYVESISLVNEYIWLLNNFHYWQVEMKLWKSLV